MAERKISTERVIAAPAARIFDVLADPAMHPVIDGSGSVRNELEGNPERLALGSRFGMAMHIGFPYRIKNTVVEFEEGRLIAWCHFGKHRWRFQLEPVGDASGVDKTRVIETFDWSTALFPPAIEWIGYPKRNLPGMVKTLVRLQQHLASDASDAADAADTGGA
jgi:Polyketide cyclase / dehydrase and lipid transport